MPVPAANGSHSALVQFAKPGNLLRWAGIPVAVLIGIVVTPVNGWAQTLVYGFDFSPLMDGQSPGNQVSADQIRARLRIIAPYTGWVRTYSSLNGLEQVCPVAHELGLKCAAGAAIYGTSVDAREMASLEQIAKGGYVDLAVVGTEAVFRQNILAQDLAGLINQFRAAAPGVTVTTADTYASYLDNPSLISAVDVMYLNVYPYYEGISLQNAPSWVNAWYQIASSAAAPKRVLISETGWPSDATPNAASYFLSLETWANAINAPLFYFEALDETWKGEAEAHLGVWTTTGAMKPGMASVFNGVSSGDTWSGNISGGSGTPAVVFDYVPPMGVQDSIRGHILHARPADYKIVCYIQAGQWYVKPFASRPFTPILADGTWSCAAPSDTEETQIAALLVSNATTSVPWQTTSLPTSAATAFAARSNAGIYGLVIDTNGLGVDNVMVTLAGTNSQSTVTTHGGKYSFVNLASGGNYTVSAFATGVITSPSSFSFPTLTGIQTGNFTALSRPFSVSGQVADSFGNAVGGITISAIGSPNVAAVTDAFGFYNLFGLTPGTSITVTPGATGYEFTPASSTLPALSSDVTLNFVASPLLSASMTHFGKFTFGQSAATYALSVSNSSATTSTGIVTVTERVPAGLTLISMAGNGWQCGTGRCSRSDPLTPGAAYPTVIATFSVSASAAALVVNRVDVSGGGSAPLTVWDTTVITSPIGDFNSDGRPDVIWQDPGSGVAQVWYLGGMQGVNFTGAANLTAQNTWRLAGVGDFNGDGHPDVIWQDPVSGAAEVWFLESSSGNVVTGTATFSTGNAWRIMSVADFNGDGIPDVIWQDQSSGWAQIWFMGGPQGTTVTGAVNLTMRNTWRIAGTGDFNGDGVPDVVWQDPVTGAVQIWYLGGPQGNVVQSAVNLVNSNASKLAAIGDFDGDGHPDVIWQDPVTGAAQVWFLTGSQGIAMSTTATISTASSWRIMGPH